VGLHDRRDQIGAALRSAVGFAQHREGLADARRRTEVDAQFPTLLTVRCGAHLLIIHLPAQLLTGYF
jgi:hypothetical protein